MHRKHVLSSAAHHFATKLAPRYNGLYGIGRRRLAVVCELTDNLGRNVGKIHVKNLKPYLPLLIRQASCRTTAVEAERQNPPFIVVAEERLQNEGTEGIEESVAEELSPQDTAEKGATVTPTPAEKP